MQEILTRRLLLERAGLVAAGLAATPIRTLAAPDLPHLSTTDPVAAALAYTEDGSKIDPSKFPSYQPGQKCATCMQNTGVAGQAWGPCSLFPGKVVSENGWCRSYVKKG
jgi:hypothetical protein